jgi:hypothetical protein
MWFAGMAFIMIMRLFEVRDSLWRSRHSSRFDGRAFSGGRRGGVWGRRRGFVGLGGRAAGSKSEQAGG